MRRIKLREYWSAGKASEFYFATDAFALRAAAAICSGGCLFERSEAELFFLYFRFEKSLPTATEYIMRSYNYHIIFCLLVSIPKMH